jgi:hypothetical protein
LEISSYLFVTYLATWKITFRCPHAMHRNSHTYVNLIFILNFYLATCCVLWWVCQISLAQIAFFFLTIIHYVNARDFYFVAYYARSLWYDSVTCCSYTYIFLKARLYSYSVTFCCVNFVAISRAIFSFRDRRERLKYNVLSSSFMQSRSNICNLLF